MGECVVAEQVMYRSRIETIMRSLAVIKIMYLYNFEQPILK